MPRRCDRRWTTGSASSRALDRPGELRHPQHRQRAVRQQRLRRPGRPTPRTRSGGCAPPASSTPSWWTRRTGARTGRSRCATTRRRCCAADTDRQHHLQRPHVRRVQHGGRGAGVPRRPSSRRGLPIVRRRVRPQPLRRQPRRGRHHGVRAGQPDRHTWAGRGAATAAASSTWTWCRTSTRPAATPWGTRYHRRGERHRVHLPRGDDLRRDGPSRHPGRRPRPARRPRAT